MSSLEQYQKSIEYYDESLIYDKNFAIPYMNKGISYYELKKYEESLKNLEISISLKPSLTTNYNFKGKIYMV